MFKLFFFLLLCSLPIAEKIEEIYKAFIKESGIQFSELEEQVLQFHLSNLEYACGSNLHQVGLEHASFCVCVFTYRNVEPVMVWITEFHGSAAYKSPNHNFRVYEPYGGFEQKIL